jgi:single-stranded-DNA-specific exonuclease
MEPVRERRWRLREADGATIAEVARGAGVPELLARLLVNRGISDVGATGRFLTATLADCYDPFLMCGMTVAVERLVAARHKGEPVCVYGDYDVDGITATALLIEFFRSAGFVCCYHIPNRMEHGYGLAEAGIRAVAAGGARVIVSVDCGVTAVAEAQLCRTLGIDLIITDHHTPGGTVPDACALLNPHLPGCTFPFKLLSGVGVAFNLLIALRTRLREVGVFTNREMPNLRQYLDLVALGTIADIVPLTDENRLFVRFGLKELSSTRRPGVSALKTVAGVTGDVSCHDVGYRLAPRLNACGRLEDATRGVELLLCRDPEEAAVIAGELDAGNTERQQLEQEILRDARSMLEAEGKDLFGIVLASEEWHPGVIGIVASRLVELYHRPTVLIALMDGTGRGSGRSIPAFHLYEALAACSGTLLKFGGHKYAAGLSIDGGAVAAFVEEFDAHAAGLLTPDDLLPELLIDAELAPEEITVELPRLIAQLEPYGAGNPSPLFLLRRVPVIEQRILKEKHLKLRLRFPYGPVDAIAFNRADCGCTGVVDLVFSPEINVWKGREGLQLKIRDLRNSEQ